MMALPHAKMLLSFESLFAILCSHIATRKFLAISSSPLPAFKSARAMCRFEMLPKWASAAVKGCGCVGHPECALVLLF